MKINEQTKEKEPKKTDVSKTYKVKDSNIQKMLEYLKKQNSNEQ
jgi:hypothetical protein